MGLGLGVFSKLDFGLHGPKFEPQRSVIWHYIATLNSQTLNKETISTPSLKLQIQTLNNNISIYSLRARDGLREFVDSAGFDMLLRTFVTFWLKG